MKISCFSNKVDLLNIYELCRVFCALQPFNWSKYFRIFVIPVLLFIYGCESSEEPKHIDIYIDKKFFLYSNIFLRAVDDDYSVTLYNNGNGFENENEIEFYVLSFYALQSGLLYNDNSVL